jgi:hypothetical protein
LPPMHPKAMKVGNAGEFRSEPAGHWRFRVDEILDPKTAVVSIRAFPDLPFVLKGFDFSKLADGSEIQIPGEWAVAGTERRAGRTLFVVEPHQPKRDRR